MKNVKKAILLDLDGTLWDSSQAVIDAWNVVIDTLPDFHRHVTLQDMQSLMGKTMDVIAYTFFDSVSKERALAIMDQCMDYENEYIQNHGGILYEGLEDTLRILHQQYFLAIVSNCQKGYIEAFLQYHGLSAYIDDTECYGRTGLPKSGSITALLERNHIAPADALYVGDIEGDYQAAQDAGLTFVHAAYGFGEAEQAQYHIKEISGLPEAAQRIFTGEE